MMQSQMPTQPDHSAPEVKPHTMGIHADDMEPQALDLDGTCDSSTDAVSGEELLTPLGRTQSQVVKQSKVQEIFQRLDEHGKPMAQLQTMVSQLLELTQDDAADLAPAGKLLQEAWKLVRNYGEDLLEDTLALDKLTGLFPQDRANKKVAIAALDKYLEDVDTAKSELSRIDRMLKGRQELQSQGKSAGKIPDPESRSLGSPCEEEEPADVSEDVDMEGLSEESTADEATPRDLKRTESQAKKQVRLEDIMQKLPGHKDSIHRLTEKVGRLAARLQKPEAAPAEEQKVLQDCRKAARNYGEDVLEDMLALDNLSGLFTEDQSNRKSTLATLDSLVAQVDAIKSELLNIEKDLKTKLDTESASAHPETPVLRLKGTGEASKKQQCTQLPIPSEEFWAALPLEVNFRSAEQPDSYAVAARTAHLTSDDIKLQLSNDGRRLNVSGAHFPSEQESEAMQEQVQRHCTERAVDGHALRHMYAKMGSGVFGSFSKDFNLPSDVDVSRISASCERGVLRITLPKAVRHRRVPRGAFHGRHPFFM